MSAFRLLLGQKISFVGTHGGANKANRIILTTLARRGWECLAVVPSRSIHGSLELAELQNQPGAGSLKFDTDGILRFISANVQVHAVDEGSASSYARPQRLIRHFCEQIAHFDPDCVLVAAEDPGYNLLRVAAELVPHRTIWLARSPSMVGVGPHAFFKDSEIPKLLRRIALVVSNSEYLRRYLLRWAAVDSVVLDAPTYEIPPTQVATGHLTTIINPCMPKGIDIAVEMARRRPQVCFGAVPTWGTTHVDLLRLRAISNFRVITPQNNIADILTESHIVIVPSLWDESFGRIAIEAMLCGIPVLASDIAGLREAKLGVPYLLPVNPIRDYLQRLDERMVRIPVVPPQKRRTVAFSS